MAAMRMTIGTPTKNSTRPAKTPARVTKNCFIELRPKTL